MELRAKMSESKVQDMNKVADLRNHYGLPPVRRGYRDCLMCDRDFFSQDLSNQKCCNSCRDPGYELRRIIRWSK